MSVNIDYAVVALLAASPVGEELISIPAGWALGLPLWNVVAVSLVFNFLPVPVLLKMMDIAGGHPHIARFTGFFRREKVLALAQKHGLVVIALLAPLAGVYAMSVAAWILGIPKGKTMLYIAAGLLLYAVGSVAVILGGEAAYGWLRQVHG